MQRVKSYVTYVGLAITTYHVLTVYIRCFKQITVIYGAHIRFWPTPNICNAYTVVCTHHGMGAAL